MGYPLVNIHNSTNHVVNGRVSYASDFCDNCPYEVQSGGNWQAPGRGVCLVTEISAVVTTPSGDINAIPYESFGTAFSRFAVISVGDNKFQVTRIVSAMEDEPPSDHDEPTEKQM